MNEPHPPFATAVVAHPIGRGLRDAVRSVAPARFAFVSLAAGAFALVLSDQGKEGLLLFTEEPWTIWIGFHAASVAWALAQLCHVLVVSTAPEAILMGGGVMERQPHLLARVPELLEESLSEYLPVPPGDYVRAPGLGSMAGPLGAIALAMNAAGDA